MVAWGDVNKTKLSSFLMCFSVPQVDFDYVPFLSPSTKVSRSPQYQPVDWRAIKISIRFFISNMHVLKTHARSSEGGEDGKDVPVARGGLGQGKGSRDGRRSRKRMGGDRGLGRRCGSIR